MQLQYNSPISKQQPADQTQTQTKTKTKSKAALAKMIKLYHTPNQLLPNQCSSRLVQIIDAPLSLVWSVVRCFDKPQVYKQFVKNCTVSSGDGTTVGSVRELVLVSGLPAERSTERLDRLDDASHVMIVSIIGGDHKLANYQSTMTLHRQDRDADNNDDGDGDGDNKTVLIESYTVGIPEDSCKEDTCFFADTIIGYNLRTLAKISEKMASHSILPWRF